MGELTVSGLARDLALNIVAITILAYALYFRRHRRRDLLVGYIAFNLSLFCVAAALGSANSISVGVGFGLFAVLSIVRLRSDETTQSEIGYTMTALVLGLLTGLPGLETEFKVVFAVLLVTGMYVADHPLLLSPQAHQRFKVTLETVETDPAALRAALEQRFGAGVKHVVVQEIDYVRETMRLDVRVKGLGPSTPAAHPEGSVRA